jgi:hypothetical protein
MDQVERLRRGVQEVAVARGLAVGRDQLDEGHDQVEGEQHDPRSDCDAVTAELPPHQPPG